MKKLFTLTRVALTLLVFMAGFNYASAKASFCGHSAINVNDTWYYCSTYYDWCSGGSFNGANLGLISSLTIGGQSQNYENNGNGGGVNWNGGTVTMYYKIDGGDAKSFALNYWKYEGNNNFFQSGGSNFSAETIDISDLSVGRHTIEVYFWTDDAWDSNNSSNYVASFIIPGNQTISAGTNGIATYSYDCPLDFSSATTITPYIVSELSATSATLTAVKQAVPANTGLIIKGAKNASENISLVAEGTSIETNYLKASVSATEIAANYAYVLNSGVFHPANAGTIPANKAYLLASDIPEIPSGSEARSLNLVFDETTGISTTQMANDLLSKDFFNLAGQRVAQPTKGFYIVNGKKVIIK